MSSFHVSGPDKRGRITPRTAPGSVTRDAESWDQRGWWGWWLMSPGGVLLYVLGCARYVMGVRVGVHWGGGWSWDWAADESLGQQVDAVPAGYPSRARWPGSNRAWLAAAVAGGSLLAAACSASPRPAPPAHRSSPARAPAVATAPAARAADAPRLRVVPAPYQLPSGVSREVVLPRGPDLLILGGLTQQSAASAAITVLNPVTGSTTAAGLVDRAHPRRGRGHAVRPGLRVRRRERQAWPPCRRSAAATQPLWPAGCPGPGPAWPR